MTGNPGHERIMPQYRTATRWASNHDWCWRGDNTKPKEKK
jgi:hypothetical protein